MSSKGVPTLYSHLINSRNGLTHWTIVSFEEGDLDTTLTQVIQSTEGLDILTPWRSVLHTVINSGEVCVCVGQIPSVPNLKIPLTTIGNTDRETTLFRRATESREYWSYHYNRIQYTVTYFSTSYLFWWYYYQTGRQVVSSDYSVGHLSHMLGRCHPYPSSS